MQEEVTQKTIALSMKTGKLTAQALQAALKKYLQHRAKGPKLHHGKQSLKQLKAHGAALTNIEVTEANIGAFKPCAKKYGVDFTLRKDKTTQPPHYIVIFKAKDVWGGSSPSTSFDCSGYISWVLNHSGWNVGRQTAQGLYNLCTPVSTAQVKPGDLVFFKGTYDTPGVSHCGIYVGNSIMLHCGDPISYTNLNSKYWQEHFYSYGRLP